MGNHAGSERRRAFAAGESIVCVVLCVVSLLGETTGVGAPGGVRSWETAGIQFSISSFR